MPSPGAPVTEGLPDAGPSSSSAPPKPARHRQVTTPPTPSAPDVGPSSSSAPPKHKQLAKAPAEPKGKQALVAEGTVQQLQTIADLTAESFLVQQKRKDISDDLLRKATVRSQKLEERLDENSQLAQEKRLSYKLQADVQGLQSDLTSLRSTVAAAQKSALQANSEKQTALAETARVTAVYTERLRMSELHNAAIAHRLELFEDRLDIGKLKDVVQQVNHCCC